MQNKNEIIYVDEKGYRERIETLEDLKRQHIEICKEKSSVKEGCASENYHDNGPFEVAMLQEYQILRMQQDYSLDNVVVVSKLENPNLIDTDDIVTIEFTCDGKPVYSNLNYTFQLVGGESKPLEKPAKISFRTPLGASVYGRQVNDVVSYVKDGRTYEAKIIDRIREFEEKGNRISLNLH